MPNVHGFLAGRSSYRDVEEVFCWLSSSLDLDESAKGEDIMDVVAILFCWATGWMLDLREEAGERPITNADVSSRTAIAITAQDLFL
mmetsp:Transcript_3552/g.6977  ORF Transcript_3552/g.6977 Transcript_3552/m.6977 type:complete len:87 (+) Transcript_3552:175-435(+)